MGVATLTALCFLQPAAHADGGILDVTYTGGNTVGVVVGTGDDIEDICAQVTTSGVVNTVLGGCEESPFTTNPILDSGVGYPDVIWVEWLVQLP